MKFGQCGTFEWDPVRVAFHLYGFACEEGVTRKHDLSFFPTDMTLNVLW